MEALSAPAGALLLAILTGCGGDASQERKQLTAADFVRPVTPEADATSPSPSAPAPATEKAPPVDPASSVTRRGVVESTGGIDDVRALVGAPAIPAPAETPPTPAPEGAPAPARPAGSAPTRVEGSQGGPRAPGGELIESLVGQINGRPIFASSFFAPMDARLRAEAKTAKSVEEWFLRKGGAREQIRAAMIETMRDELLLAEFEASLSPEQKQGVLAFVEDLRGNLASLAEGSEELANKRLLESEGLTFEEKVRMERDRELIRAQVTRALGDRAIVAWREVVQAYERDAEKYNPPPVARFRVIQAPLRDPERVERVKQAVDAGENWADIARRDGQFKAVAGGLHEVTVSRDGFEKTVFFSGEPLNAAVRTLKPGEQTTLDFADSRFWIRLESIDQPPRTTLYDAQLPISATLTSQRLSEEEARYFNRLATRASLSDINQMLGRLERLAIERYFPGILLDQPSAPAPPARGAQPGPPAPTKSPSSPPAP